jgi:hypothetical protein
MGRTQFYRALGIALAGFGTVIATGALLTDLGIDTGIDAGSLLVGAGIAVAGAGAAAQFSSEPSETPDADPGDR